MNKRYLVAVSGGSDSMALLDMLYKKGHLLIVAHVNYKKRESADRDETIVRLYCQKNSLVFEVLYPQHESGNFQNWARKVRFDFFKELINKYSLAGVYLGHQADDLLETYLIQKTQNRVPLYWGLLKETKINGLKIYRPLLNYKKEDLLNYCIDNNIEYGEDESNHENKYLRNKIRNTILINLNEKKRNELLNEIKEANIKLSNFNKEVDDILLKLSSTIKINEYLKINDNLKLEVLRKWLFNNGVKSLHYSLKYLNNINEFIKASGNGIFKLNDKKQIVKNYNKLEVIKGDNHNYLFQIETLKEFETAYFKVCFSGGKFEGVTVSKKDFPLTIRNWQKEDKIELSYGSKSARRYFIDNKIPYHQRLLWPIVLNSENKVILIPGLGANITDRKSVV